MHLSLSFNEQVYLNFDFKNRRLFPTRVSLTHLLSTRSPLGFLHHVPGLLGTAHAELGLPARNAMSVHL